ncbi:hypothetical protein HPB50_012877 [Hyalomma asiaticum]|uniref:Uncharacterized protein n=1 Tax=Hyalomma asiaticum TaxID=266040 RepID=A0ACB7TGX9_HYAAI|nr:hypothetical protein HPB50_012877 [Hyalomma asiaticum]
MTNKRARALTGTCQKKRKHRVRGASHSFHRPAFFEMGTSLSRKCGASQRQNSGGAPLTTVGELSKHPEHFLLCAVEHLSDTVIHGNVGEPRMKFRNRKDGKYEEHRLIHGCDGANVSGFNHRQMKVTFMYYSRCMVTIPIPRWIFAGHWDCVKFPGNITLRDDNTDIFHITRGSCLRHLVAAHLTNKATNGRFNGWIISTGCKIAPWYDAMAIYGKPKPHRKRLSKSASLWERCDGVFLNFDWNNAVPLSSAQLADSRKDNVYAGVDVYTRGISYPLGHDMYSAIQLAIRYHMLAVVFEVGWVYETQEKNNFAKDQNRQQQRQPQDRLYSHYSSYCSGKVLSEYAYEVRGTLCILLKLTRQYCDINVRIR